MRAADVVYQSGLVAVEGSQDLAVEVITDARRVDLGELADASYQPGARLLGTYGFSGEPAEVKAVFSRPPAYGLSPVIVENAELHTLLSAEGMSQTAATFRLRAKAADLQIVLPERANPRVSGRSCSTNNLSSHNAMATCFW